MKITIAIVLSCVTAVCVTLTVAAFLPVRLNALSREISAGAWISFLFLALPVTVLHTILKKKRSDSFAIYAAVGSVSLFTFGLLQSLVVGSQNPAALASTLTALVVAGSLGGLVYRIAVGSHANQKRA